MQDQEMGRKSKINSPTGIEKTCSKCSQVKDLCEFPTKSSKCRECRKVYLKSYYDMNPDKGRAWRAASYKARGFYREMARVFIEAYFDFNPCVDCGEDDHVVLDFDHRNPSEKWKGIGALVCGGYPIEDVWTEIQKCDVRCANCHRRRTATQRNWWKIRRAA